MLLNAKVSLHMLPRGQLDVTHDDEISNINHPTTDTILKRRKSNLAILSGSKVRQISTVDPEDDHPVKDPSFNLTCQYPFAHGNSSQGQTPSAKYKHQSSQRKTTCKQPSQSPSKHKTPKLKSITRQSSTCLCSNQRGTETET